MHLSIGNFTKRTLIFLALVLLCCAVHGQSKLKLVSYNIWNGYDWGKDTLRRERLLSWMDSRVPDIVALQELCAYTQEKLDADAGAWGHNHSVLLKTSGYSVGLTSRHPIVVKEKIMEGMHHGALHCEVSGIHVFVIHLSPFSWEKRNAETDILLSRINRLMAEGKDVIVCGDFNALSPIDYSMYRDNLELLEGRKEREKEHDHIRNLRNDMFCYSVMSKFLGAGLYDVCAKFVDEGPDRTTSPTLIFAENMEDEAHLLRNGKRIDFILASYPLAGKCQNAFVLNKGETTRLSDHYPVECEFEFNEVN